MQKNLLFTNIKLVGIHLIRKVYMKETTSHLKGHRRSSEQINIFIGGSIYSKSQFSENNYNSN